jgi:hypothetical protein
MGADQSTLSAAEEAGIKHAEEAMQQGYEEEKRKDQERKLKRKATQESPSTEQSPIVVSDLESGEVTESSADSITVPIRSAHSSQSTPGASDILAALNLRKEREPKTKSVNGKSMQEEFLGFGNESSTQPHARQPTKERPKLDTTADSIKVSRKTHSASSRKRSGAPKAPMISAKAPAPPSKRPAAEAASRDEHRISLSALPKIQKRTSVASPQSPDRAEVEKLPSDGERHPPRWYGETQVSLVRNKNDAGIDTLLSSLRSQVSKSRNLKAPHQIQELQKVFTEVRHKLHAIIFQEVNPQVLKRNRMLHTHNGLSQIFDERYSNGVKWPFDIEADAEEVYAKWSRKDFGTDIMRGIKFSISIKGIKDGGDSIDPAYLKNVVPAKKHGHNGLVNGQWWPFQICALRDGAHGSIQGGISGASGEGAYSCIMSGGVDSQGKPYPDRDEGDVIWYCGTDSDNREPTGELSACNINLTAANGFSLKAKALHADSRPAYTQRMLESAKGKPVRLIRSHNAHTQYAPELGFRYDGLYDVTEVEQIDPENSIRQRHRFKLVRRAGQDPIRGGSGPEKRPTLQEIDEYNKHQRLSGKGNGQSSTSKDK